jgi:hypothetical protein
MPILSLPGGSASRRKAGNLMPKRKERVAPPPTKDGWDIRYATSDAVDGWELIGRSAPANLRLAWERITADPRAHDHRQHRLKGELGSRTVNDIVMEQWQYEVTAGGRIWYCIDDTKRTIWLTETSPGHPKATE